MLPADDCASQKKRAWWFAAEMMPAVGKHMLAGTLCDSGFNERLLTSCDTDADSLHCPRLVLAPNHRTLTEEDYPEQVGWKPAAFDLRSSTCRLPVCLLRRSVCEGRGT
jgi:hypothetical protein